MKRNIHLSLTSLLLMLFVLACNIESDVIEKTNNVNDLSIADAKEWLVKNVENSGIESKQNFKRKIYWEYAEIFELY